MEKKEEKKETVILSKAEEKMKNKGKKEKEKFIKSTITKNEDSLKTGSEKIEKNDSNTNNPTKKKKTRRNIVLLVFVIVAVVIYIVERGKYLEIKEIGEKYIPIFWKNFRAITITAGINFVFSFSLMYFSTKKIKLGLKTFFEDEKKAMPKLPQKSIAFIVAILVTIFTSNFILEKALLCFNNAQFVISTPVLGYDIGYFVFIWPFIELMVKYLLIAIIAIAVYSTLYYLIVFNMCFDGINRDTVKKSPILNQGLEILRNLIVVFAILVLVETQNIGVQKFISLNSGALENYSLFGAGSTEVHVKLWAYILLAFVIVFSAFKAINQFKKGNTRKVIKNILIVPIYLVLVLVVMLGYNLIFVNSNELDKEKEYIQSNIKYTKMAYGIDIDTVSIDNGGTITEPSINNNQETITNIPITNKELLIKDLNSSLTSKGYYEFANTIAGIYPINGKSKLVYVTPREIANSNSTYNNKTYEYTHGFGTIITAASETTNTGNLNHIQKDFENTNLAIKITEPRIYFGMRTNNTVVTNSNSKKEFDYPTLDASDNAENVYDGKAGLEATFFDRLILAVKEKDAKLLFSGNVKSDSKILTNRNIVERAKAVMPYLTYDPNPYTVIRNDGSIVWVLDAYTTSNNYPYSQRTVLEDNGIKKNEINYIRNSVKVIIDAYNGYVTFYITDEADPIAIAYKNIYPNLFTTEKIPEDISNHFVYPEYLYNIQSQIIERYHNVKPDVLYRSDDVWDVATHNTSKISTKKGTAITPYYTMVNTLDYNSTRLGLVLPYTPYDKQNITAYLVGSVDENGKNILKIYNYPTDSNVIGPMQLDTQIEQDEKISAEIETLNVAGTKIIKDMIIVPIENTLLYVEPIYQQYVNETNSLPILKKVIIASGNKVAIGNTFTEALNNLVSKYAVNIEIADTNNINELVDAVVKANNNLKTSTQSNDWEQIGRDTKKFEVGKTYEQRSICDNDCIFKIEVIKRTEKTLTYIYDGQQRRSKIKEWDGSEMIRPDNYSMAPSFHA